MAAKKPPTKSNRSYRSYDLLLLNGDLYEPAFGQLVQALQDGKKHDNVVVILVTYGGAANTAYRIARLMQLMYKEFIIFVPGICKSAGTLLAIGANKIILTPFSELGPLDVHLLRKDELGERRSGLIIHYSLQELQKQSFELFEHLMLHIYVKSQGNVRFRTCADVAATMAAQLMSKIYEQIDVSQLGEDERNMEVGFEYGKRLRAHAGNISEINLHRLTYKYPSHDFVIDFTEAREIFERVEMADGFLYKLVVDEPWRFMVPVDDGSRVEMLTVSHESVETQESGDDGKEPERALSRSDARDATRNG